MSDILKRLIELVNPTMSELRPYVKAPDDAQIGWCSSCDKIFDPQEFVQAENRPDSRPACPNCGDWLVFAETEEG